MGTKADLASAREVPREEAEGLCGVFGETSAATGQQVEELFQALSERLPSRKLRGDTDSVRGEAVKAFGGLPRLGMAFACFPHLLLLEYVVESVINGY